MCINLLKLPPSQPSPKGEGDEIQHFPLGGNGKEGKSKKGIKTLKKSNHKVVKLKLTQDGLLQKDY
jgi:hypothetical protein